MEPEEQDSPSESRSERQPLLVARNHELLAVAAATEPIVTLNPPSVASKDVEAAPTEKAALRVTPALDPIPIRLASTILAVLLAGFFSTAITYRGWSVLPALDLAGVYVALAPILFVTFLLGLPPTAKQFQVR